MRFDDVTERAGLAHVGWGQGVCAGDYDNNGYRDLFVTYFGQSVLYRNQGDGTFRDVTEAAGLRMEASRWDTGCSFVGYDLDGRLDLVVTNYLEFDRAKASAAYRSRGRSAPAGVHPDHERRLSPARESSGWCASPRSQGGRATPRRRFPPNL